MDPKDTFFKKLQPLEDFAKLFEKSERFGSWNQKTLGIVLVSGVVLLQYVFVLAIFELRIIHFVYPPPPKKKTTTTTTTKIHKYCFQFLLGWL